MLRYDEGRYADLFSRESYAVWIDREVMALKRKQAIDAGQRINERMEKDVNLASDNFIIIESRIVSEFADASVAYDVVRPRSIESYLITPDGKRVLPIQTHSIGPVDEEQHNALKRFTRTHIAIFPRDDLWVGKPTIKADTQSVQFVLEGHTSKFYFEWPGTMSEEVRKRSLTSEDYQRIVHTGFLQLYDSIGRLAHIFS